jgi:hypothetical protein
MESLIIEKELIMNTITQEQIDKILEEAEQMPEPHQADAMIRLYKLMIPEWEDVKQLHGWPKVGKDLSRYCIRKFQEFDEKYHPHVMPAGIWINNGPSTNEKLQDWEFSLEGVEIEMNN